MAEGDLTVRVPVSGNDEIADLARAFNEMADRLQEADHKQRELEQLRRDLVAWAGHDLRTPLASTRVMIDALADGLVDDPATAKRYLQTSQRDIKTLSLLIDDLFNLAQMDAGGLKLERRPTAISDLISDTLESFAALAVQREVSLSGQVEAGVDPVLGDGQQIAARTVQPRQQCAAAHPARRPGAGVRRPRRSVGNRASCRQRRRDRSR